MKRYQTQQHVIFRFEEQLNTGVVFDSQRKKALTINIFACKILQLITSNPMTPEEIEYSTAIPATAVKSILKALEQEGFVTAHIIGEMDNQTDH